MTQQVQQQLVINPVRDRYLFFSPTVQGRLDREACSTDFEVIQPLGQGAFGKVYKVRHKKTKQVYALKQIQKKQIRQQKMIQQIINEVKIMYNIDHQNIIKLFNHYEEEEYIYLILECATGGQLWHKLSGVGRFDEQTVKQYIGEIMSAIEYLHTKKPPIIHRDIKPENILLDKDGRVKLADFGWSNFFNNTKRQTYCGTLDYLAPEMILEQGHDEKLDYWSIGVLIFELLVGKAPFTPSEQIKDPREQQKALEENIVRVKIMFPPDFPTLAKSLVQGLLIKDPAKRFTLVQMKEHPWFTVGQQAKVQAEIKDAQSFKKDDIKDIVQDDKGQFSKDEIINIANRQNKSQEEEDQIIVVEDTEKPQKDDPTKTTVQILNSKIQEITKQLNECKVLLQVKSEENIQLQQQIVTTQPTVISNAEQRRFRLLEEERDKLKKDYDKLWEELRVKDSQINKLNSENRRIEELQKQIDKHKGDKQNLQEKIRKLNEEIQLKDQELYEFKVERESTIRVTKQSSFLSGIQGAPNPGLQDESFSSNMSIIDLNTSFNEMKSRFQIAKEQIEEFDVLQRRIIQLENENIQYKTQIENLKDEIRSELQFHYEEEQEKLQSQLAQNEETANKKIQQLRDENQKEKEVLTKKLSQLDVFQMENESLKKQLEYSSSIIQDMKQEWEQNKKIRSQYEIRLKDQEVTILDLREQERQWRKK